jgi:alcohol dehydrogenase
MLPHVLEWCAIGCPEKLAAVAVALGEPVDGLSTGQAAERGLAAVRRLAAAVEIDQPMRSLGVTEGQLAECARRVYAQHTPRSVGGPRGFRSEQEALSLLEKAY